MERHTEESECEKIRTRKFSDTDIFHAVEMNRATIMEAREVIFDIKY